MNTIPASSGLTFEKLMRARSILMADPEPEPRLSFIIPMRHPFGSMIIENDRRRQNKKLRHKLHSHRSRK